MDNGNGGSDSLRERMGAIFQLLGKTGSVRVTELQEQLGVSDMTIRRCLNAMAADGLIRRVHGGAEAVDGGESRFMQMRHSLNTNVKSMLAVRALEFVPENASIYIDSGTTCFAVAKTLAASGRRLNLITDSINVIRELQGAREITATLLGGALCDDMTTLDGPFAADAASRVNLDLCLFSADAFNEERVENRYLAGATTRKILIARSRRTMCICDSSKYGQRCCFMFCGWEDVDVFLTDAGIPAHAREAIADKGVDVQVVRE